MTMESLVNMDKTWLAIAATCHVFAAIVSFWRNRGRFTDLWLSTLMLSAVTAMFAGLLFRWLRTGQGPFLTLFDVLTSNIFSLGLIYFLLFVSVPRLRTSAPAALTILGILGVWALSIPADPVPLPATFSHSWLWAHVISGKIFLGFAMTGSSQATMFLFQARTDMHRDYAADDQLLWRIMAVAFLFQSFMLVAGAVWAQDAWGRFWTWDPLETWAFITWLVLAGVFHLRATLRLPLWVGWCGVIVVFMLAFLTFFGLPFFSGAPHKGVF